MFSTRTKSFLAGGLATCLLIVAIYATLVIVPVVKEARRLTAYTSVVIGKDPKGNVVTVLDVIATVVSERLAADAAKAPK